MTSSLRILLADDSRFFRTIERKFLQKTPLEIFEAEDSASALAIVRKEKPDLIYMAFSLAPDGGPECCRALKRDPELRQIPVVMICDQGETAQTEQAISGGADAFLTKPLDRHSFLNAGRKFLPVIREYRKASFLQLTFFCNGEKFKGKCLDVSSGGIFIESQADIKVGDEITLKLKLPDLASELDCVAKISWLNRKPNPMKPHYPHGFGAQFTALPDYARKAISAYSARKNNS
ncbi:MAG: response regulator [Desulfuromonadales bacterium]|nr:response regulator [Desulfuromonadales bacterium]